ncbi:MAG: hypothetical protein JRM80_04665 [Nitrososphaerota archaeon]|nr:hypothetical protein [Nitrososphaerota archaeon]
MTPAVNQGIPWLGRPWSDEAAEHEEPTVRVVATVLVMTFSLVLVTVVIVPKYDAEKMLAAMITAPTMMDKAIVVVATATLRDGVTCSCLRQGSIDGLRLKGIVIRTSHLRYNN